MTKSWRPPGVPPSIPGLKYVYFKDSLNISCLTNNQNSTVTLLHQTTEASPKVDVLTKKLSSGRIYRNGQMFDITSVVIGDAGFYTCRASIANKTVELEKGQLRVDACEYSYY